MIILLIITVAISTLSSYIGQRSIDPSKFDANIDIRKEFSVPYYSCPVEIDVSIRGGGNATFYLVKGKDLSDNPLEDEKNAKYIVNNTIASVMNTRNFHLERELDSGDYTLYILHLQEKKDDEKPIIVGVDVENDMTGSIAYTSYSKVQYNKVNIFILKPILPYVYIVFIISEIFLIVWFFSFIVRRRMVREEKEPQPVSYKVRIEKVPKRDATSSWKTTLRGERGTTGSSNIHYSPPTETYSNKKSLALPEDTSVSSAISHPTVPSEASTPNLPELTKIPPKSSPKKDAGDQKKKSKPGKKDKKVIQENKDIQISSILEGLRNSVSTIEREEVPAHTSLETTDGEKLNEEEITLDDMNLDDVDTMDQFLQKVNASSDLRKTRTKSKKFSGSLEDRRRIAAFSKRKHSSNEVLIEEKKNRNDLDTEMEKLGKLDPKTTRESKEQRVKPWPASPAARERRAFPSDRKEKLEKTFARILKEKSDEVTPGSKKQKKMDTLRERMDSLLSQIIED